MNDTPDRELLTEIRDLLRVLAEANMTSYSAVVRQRLGKTADAIVASVGSTQQWEALELMDGAHSQADIRSLTGMDAGYLSRFVKKLGESKLVNITDGNPSCVVSPWEIKAVRYGRN